MAGCVPKDTPAILTQLGRAQGSPRGLLCWLGAPTLLIHIEHLQPRLWGAPGTEHRARLRAPWLTRREGKVAWCVGPGPHCGCGGIFIDSLQPPKSRRVSTAMSVFGVKPQSHKDGPVPGPPSTSTQNWRRRKKCPWRAGGRAPRQGLRAAGDALRVPPSLTPSPGTCGPHQCLWAVPFLQGSEHRQPPAPHPARRNPSSRPHSPHPPCRPVGLKWDNPGETRCGSCSVTAPAVSPVKAVAATPGRIKPDGGEAQVRAWRRVYI